MSKERRRGEERKDKDGRDGWSRDGEKSGLPKRVKLMLKRRPISGRQSDDREV